MKKIYLLLSVLMGLCPAKASAQEILSGAAHVENPVIQKVADRLFVSLDIAPSNGWKLKSNRSLILTPVIEKEGNRSELVPVEILGRKQYIYRQRNGKTPNYIYKASKAGTIHYETSVPYEAWMDGATLLLNEDLCGCCRTVLASETHSVKQTGAQPLAPIFAYIVPKTEQLKVRAESGQAFILFRASHTDIDENYSQNRTELQKILSTISRVKENGDLTIQGISLKGNASPEGSYDMNEKLAKGRMQAINRYLKARGAIDNLNISTSYEAENWDGLRTFIEKSDLPDRQALLELIDSPKYAADPDVREWALKTNFPAAYRTLLRECYPSLRRTDYSVSYTVRPFSTDEAKSLIKTRPQELSLEEMYYVAQTYTPGSEEFNDVFETAVRMFPDDATANLNAANSALQRNDTILAERYLQKAGGSGEAQLARGILAMLKGNLDQAEALMKSAASLGVRGAQTNLERLLKQKQQ